MTRQNGRSRLRILSMTVLPVAFLALGVAGYRHLTAPIATPAASLATADAGARQKTRRRGPHGPRYGRGQWQGRKRAPQTPVVAARKVAMGSWRPRFVLHGRIVAARTLQLRMTISGRVAEAAEQLRPGGEVRKGQLLVRLDDFSRRLALAGASAQLEEARARVAEQKEQLRLDEASLQNALRQLDLARRARERTKVLARDGTASRKALDDAALVVAQRELTVVQKKSALRISAARLKQYEAQQRQKEQALAQARRDLRDTRLFAPFDGAVLSAQVEKGQYVSGTEVLATLAARHELEVRFALSEDQYGDLLAAGAHLKGMPVRIVWKAGRTRLVSGGRIVRLAAQLKAESGTLDVYARLDDIPRMRELRLNAFVEVHLEGPPLRNVARLPEGAMHDGRVFVLREGRLEGRKVNPVAWENGEVIVQGSIKDGDLVMASHLPQARDGMRVKVARP